MERKEYKITINAPKEKVWSTLWNDVTYRAWTSAFAEGSHVKTDWKKGSKALFLDGKNEGMISTIAENKPNEFMSIKHLGVIKNGVEDMDNEWAGGSENYTLSTVNGKTELRVDMDITEEFRDYFEKTWPKALDKLKELTEKN
jgi:activator of Hsp90 ATPase-like protein